MVARILPKKKYGNILTKKIYGKKKVTLKKKKSIQFTVQNSSCGRQNPTEKNTVTIEQKKCTQKIR